MSVNTVGGPSQSPITMMDSYDQVSAELGGDTDAQIAALMLVSSHEQRESLGEARQATEKRLESAENKQVQSLRDQADHLETAGLVKGLAQVLGGLVEIGGAGDAGGGGTGGSAPASAIAQLSSGAAGVYGSMEKYDADMAGADATAADHRTDASKRTLDDIRDDDRAARDVAQKALDMVEKLQDTRAAMSQAALFRRA